MQEKGSGCFNILEQQRSDHDEHLLRNRKIVIFFPKCFLEESETMKRKQGYLRESVDHLMIIACSTCTISLMKFFDDYSETLHK